MSAGWLPALKIEGAEAAILFTLFVREKKRLETERKKRVDID